MKKILIKSFLLLSMGVFAFASGQSDDSVKDDGSLKVVLILSGPANDQGWNAVALQGWLLIFLPWV